MPDSLAFVAALREAYAPVGTVSLREAALMATHYGLLVRWNKVLNLTRVERLADAVVRHYCESLFLADRLPGSAGSVLDVGSGAGFPGIPLAVRKPAWRVTLAESHQRKAVFLREATRGLPNVTVAAHRAGQVEAEFDWVVSRALRWREVASVARAGIALLLGEEDAGATLADRNFTWCAPERLPWGRHRLLLMGQRST